MKRIIFQDLCEWRADPERLPLIIRGARQVGKTHVVRQLGSKFKNFVEINFEKQSQLYKVFEFDLDPERILRDLQAATQTRIIPGESLLFFDEVQQAPKAITALRYFYEELPSLHIIAAGSLVDFAIDQIGIPVGRVAYLFMYPMSFIEFLAARGYQQLAIEILNHDASKELSSPLHDLGMRLLGEYFAIGGMPKAVQVWSEQQDVLKAMQVLSRINNVYQDDFAKYAKKHQIKYLDLLFQQLPKLVAQRFKYSVLKTDYRKRELAPAIDLLEKAGIINRIYQTKANGIPLGAELSHELFKIITLDIGLNQNILGFDLQDWFLDPCQALINKGNLTEAFIGQEMMAYSDPNTKNQLYYWQREARGSHAEVDYVTALKNQIIPIEVKSGYGSSFKSMRLFLESHEASPFGVRFSIHNFSQFDGIHSYPLYAVANCLPRKKRLLQYLSS